MIDILKGVRYFYFVFSCVFGFVFGIGFIKGVFIFFFLGDLFWVRKVFFRLFRFCFVLIFLVFRYLMRSVYLYVF